MTASSPRFAFAWYFHLPAIATEIEVRDHVLGSLEPLVRVHREHDIPYLLAPTGSFLRHCEQHSPEILAVIRSEIEAGRLCLGASYLYETDPLSVPWMSLLAHVAEDLEVKRQLLGHVPRIMFLPNFTWRAGLERILIDNGIRGVLLDSRQLQASSEARAWRWEAGGEGRVSTAAVPVPTEPWEHRRVQTLMTPHGSLRLVFRDWTPTRALTFGNDGAIHEARPERAVHHALSECLGDARSEDLVVLGDDGDRIRGMSLPGYRALLEATERCASWSELLNEAPASPRLRELPSYSPPGIDALLRGSVDARFYWSLLEELRSFTWGQPERREQLPLDDVFYAYWPGVGRRQWYVDRTLDWIELGIRRECPDTAVDGSSRHPAVDYGEWNV